MNIQNNILQKFVHYLDSSVFYKDETLNTIDVSEKLYTEDEKFLARLQEQEEVRKASWKKVLNGCAERLSTLLSLGENADNNHEAEAVDIAITAWRLGSTECMKLLHSMAISMYEEKYNKPVEIDYISIWWDGIGDWRSPWFRKIKPVLF